MDTHFRCRENRMKNYCLQLRSNAYKYQ
jgi:hypothetical protein